MPTAPTTTEQVPVETVETDSSANDLIEPPVEEKTEEKVEEAKVEEPKAEEPAEKVSFGLKAQAIIKFCLFRSLTFRYFLE